MTITFEDVGTDLRRINIAGRLDVGGVKILAPELADLIATHRKQVVIDLTALELLTSIGIRALIESAKVVRMRGGKVAMVVHPSSIVSMSLLTTGIDSVIPIFKTYPEALQSVQA